MKSSLLTIIIVIFFLLILGSNTVCVGEKLKKDEVVDLLSGNTAKDYYMQEGQQQSVLMGRVGIEIKFLSDGTAEKTTFRAKGSKGAVTEKGNWSVNKKGKLCTKWLPENKKRCGRLERASGGKYELHRKAKTVFYEEIVPGI